MLFCFAHRGASCAIACTQGGCLILSRSPHVWVCFPAVGMAIPPAATALTDRKCHNLDVESGLVGLAILCFVLAGGVQEGPTSCGSSYALIEGRPSPETETPNQHIQHKMPTDKNTFSFLIVTYRKEFFAMPLLRLPEPVPLPKTLLQDRSHHTCDVVACSRCSRLQSIVFGELIQINFCRNHRSTKRGGPGASGLHVSSLMIMLRRRQSLCFCDIASRRCHITLSISAPYPTCHHRH